MKNEGVTLIELLVVVSIVGVLIVALGFSYEGWLGNYRIENVTKELYFDLMDARTKAMTKNRIHWVILEPTQFTIIEDANDNATLDATPPDVQILQEEYDYDYNLTIIGAGLMPQTITFDTRGLMNPQETFRFINTRDPDYDCIAIEQSRIWIGKYDKESGVCERR